MIKKAIILLAVSLLSINVEAECPVRVNTRTYELTPKTPIEPLVKCLWSQSAPFNWNTPIHEEAGIHYLAGCGATALAQVMFYYKNPGCDALPAYSAGLEEIDGRRFRNRQFRSPCSG